MGNNFTFKLLGLIVCLFVNFNLFAQEAPPVTIHVEREGDLYSLISSSKKYQITNLTVTGNIGTEDNYFLREMAGYNATGGVKTEGKLAILDLSNANIKGSWNFINCDKLTSITMPKSNIEIAVGDFRGCTNLKEINIPTENINYSSINGVVFSKDQKTLYMCPIGKVGKYVIPSGVTTVSNNAFTACNLINHIEIPDDVSQIGSFAFSECLGLKSITLPDNWTKIEDGLFWQCSNLENIFIPENVSEIGHSAFEGCAIESINIPNNVSIIGENAFAKCEKLKSIQLPESITKIEKSLFYMCKQLEHVYIPNSVTEIDGGAFAYCDKLTSLIIPNSVVKIGDRDNYSYTFPNTIKELHILSTNPPEVSTYNNQAFNNIMNTCVLYVPKGAYNNYWGIAHWGDFKMIVEEGSEIPITKISLNKTSLSLSENENETLIATIEPEQATDKTIIWQSSDETIATVDNKGKVLALKAGTTTITATSVDEKVSASCNLTVKKTIIPVTGISLNKSELNLEEGKEETLIVNITPENATDKNVTWISDNKSIATVNSEGKVTAIKSGTTNIVVKSIDGKHSTKCKIKVIAKTIAIKEISLNKNTLSLVTGSSESLIVSFIPNNATNKQVQWSSSNTKVVTVDQKGKVTAISQGEATVTVSTLDGDIQNSCKVNVSNKIIPVTGLELNFRELSMYVNNTETLFVTVYPSNATEQSVIWTSDNTDIVSIDENGNIKALKEGSATITAMIKGYDFSANCKINVSLPVIRVTGVTLNQTKLEMYTGKKMKLNAIITPESASNKNVRWTSSNDDIATISSTGEVYAIQSGSVIITATTIDGNYSATCSVLIKSEAISVSSISINKTSLTLQLGETDQLQAFIKPENASNKDVTWNSSDNNIVTVDNEGYITTLNTGSAIITAVSASNTNVKATCKVLVSNKYTEGQITYLITSNQNASIYSASSEITELNTKESVIINGKAYKVTSIEEEAFERCSRLKKVYISSTIETIGALAFYDCYNLKCISINNSIPPIYGNKCFSTAVIPTATLHVPKGSRQVYSTANGWSNFWNIEEEYSTDNELINSKAYEIRISKNEIHINSDKRIEIYIYDFKGQLFKRIEIQGYEVFSLPKGVYILTVGNQNQKVIIK